MASINSIFIDGNLTKAAELSRWGNGTPYCRFTIAHNESYKDDAGNWVDIPSFFDCFIKGNYAESMHKHLCKGRWVLIEAHLKQNRWKDKDGNSHSAVNLVVDKLKFAPGSFQPKEEGQQGGAPNFKPADCQAAAEDYGPPPAEDDYIDSGIPF